MGIDAPQWLLPAYLRSVKAVGGTASVEDIRVQQSNLTEHSFSQNYPSVDGLETVPVRHKTTQ